MERQKDLGNRIPGLPLSVRKSYRCEERVSKVAAGKLVEGLIGGESMNVVMSQGCRRQ